MNGDDWLLVLAVALAINAVAGFGYRVFRLTKGGPLSDVFGQAVLGLLLAAFAVAAALDAHWVVWPAVIYGLLFGVVVMPVWILAVLIPQRPGALDYGFTALYWTMLVVIVIAGFAA